MDVGRAFARGLREQGVDHADDGRVVLAFQQVLDGGDVLHQARQIDFAFDFIHHLRGTASLRVVRLGSGLFELFRGDHVQPHRAEHARQFRQRGLHGLRADPHVHAVLGLLGNQQAGVAGEGVRHEAGGQRRGCRHGGVRSCDGG